MKIKIFTALIIIFSAVHVLASEHFVRPDGGNWDQCDGKTNIAYTDDVIARQCAVSHLFELLDPQNKNVKINGGDIITVMNNTDGTPAEYAMGAHKTYTKGSCDSSWAYACTMPSLPAGTAENPTILRGELVDGSCNTKPILWGTGRAKTILTIDNAEYVQLNCLTVTDKSSCIGASGYPDSSLICDRSAPFDKPFADTGILIRDSSNIQIIDVNVQGLNKGIHAGRLKNISLTRVNLFANYAVGWDGDIEYLDPSGSKLGNANTGTMRFTDSAINFNGCGLIYDPASSKHNQPHACARQDIGGYGDGMGTGKTGGDWIFDNVTVMHNSSDGIDLLYHELEGKTVIKNSRIEGNAGNQVKISGNAELVNNIIIGSCAWNSRQEAYLGREGEVCRAGGNALSLHFTHANTKISVINNTVYSEGDIALGTGNRTKVVPSNQSLYVINNVFYARIDYRQNFENSALYYTTNPFPHTQIHNNIIHKPKNGDLPCTNFLSNVPANGNANAGFCTDSGAGKYYNNDDHTTLSNPHFPDIDLGKRYSAYDIPTLKRESSHPYALDENSPIVDNGYNGYNGYNGIVSGINIPTTDFYGKLRVGFPDIGAVEYAPKPNPPNIKNIEKR